MGWTTGNGSNVSYQHFLNRAYQTGNIPSVSFGLHVGSIEPIHEIATSQAAKKSGNRDGAVEMEVPAYIGELQGSDVYRRSQVLS